MKRSLWIRITKRWPSLCGLSKHGRRLKRVPMWSYLGLYRRSNDILKTICSIAKIWRAPHGLYPDDATCLKCLLFWDGHDLGSYRQADTRNVNHNAVKTPGMSLFVQARAKEEKRPANTPTTRRQAITQTNEKTINRHMGPPSPKQRITKKDEQEALEEVLASNKKYYTSESTGCTSNVQGKQSTPPPPPLSTQHTVPPSL